MIAQKESEEGVFGEGEWSRVCVNEWGNMSGMNPQAFKERERRRANVPRAGGEQQVSERRWNCLCTYVDKRMSHAPWPAEWGGGGHEYTRRTIA